MRLKIIFILIFIGFQTLYAQTAYGIKGGFNLSKYHSDFTDIYSYKSGFYLGGTGKFELSNTFNLKPEIFFSYQGSDLKTNIELNYANDPQVERVEISKIRINEYAINVPVLLDFSLSESFYLEAGPQAGFIFKNSTKVVKGSGDYGSFEGEENNDLRISLAFDFGINYKITKDIYLGARYSRDIKRQDSSLTNSIISTGLEFYL
ncbi:porin family protein [Salegentibacter sp. Hel_I_6]|uniref:porin family protein n=1 Tax=Salegentibacter sp. Hel_I_6 TaxID=1250278 RepID=UPI0005650360|nr:porin family protein [Salegentibacter sp. Hel_I_6]